ncbi:hypothetical protein [Sorangium sp. So ce1151]|uniref:hypothetical protein n=1 Tax=Sorangium sp. So ce1151 TaxID=3133332 RepID=UPI003F63F1E8
MADKPSATTGAAATHSAVADHQSSIRGLIQGGHHVGTTLVVGDHATVLVGPQHRLREARLSPQPVYERVRLDHFAGRAWLVEEIDRFIAQNDRGTLLVEAPAGLGKTTLLAHLARERGWISHFVELAPSDAGVEVGIRSLVAQLTAAWELASGGDDAVMPADAGRPEALRRALFDAAAARDRNGPGRPVVLVVDGLDEAGTPEGHNVLGLPRVLPRGVFFIASSRPTPFELTTEGPRRIVRIDPERGENLADLDAWLATRLRAPRVQEVLAGAGVQTDALRRNLLARSAGVWVYVHYVLEQIERSTEDLNLEDLPQGLWRFYAAFWRRRRTRRAEHWERLDLPLLGVLAAVQEDASAEFLAHLAGVDPASARRLLNEEMRPFLHVTGRDERLYKLYHASLREFLSGRAESAEMLETDGDLVRDLEANAQRAHGRIADVYLASWGGLFAKWSAIATGDPRTRYGIRNLVAHLESARREEDLHQVLFSGLPEEQAVPYRRPGFGGLVDRLLRRKRTPPRRIVRNQWYEVCERADAVDVYLADLERARRAAERAAQASCNRANGGALPDAALGRQVQYLLARASVRSRATQLIPGMLPRLVSAGVWPASRALSYASQRVTNEGRAMALIGLLAVSTGRERDATRAMALEALRAAGALDNHIGLLGDLVEHFDQPALEEVARWTLGRGDWSYSCAPVFALVAPRLDPEHASRLLESAREHPSVEVRICAAATLCGRVPTPIPQEVREAATNIACNMQGARGPALLLLASHAEEDLRDRLLMAVSAALAWAHRIDYALPVLRYAAFRVPKPLWDSFIGVCVPPSSLARGRLRVAVLSALASFAPEALRRGALECALDDARSIDTPQSRHDCLAIVATQAARLGHQEIALAAVRAGGTEYSRFEIVRGVAPHLSAGELGLLWEELQMSHTAPHYPKTTAALLARRAALGDLDGALEHARKADDSVRTDMLQAIAIAAPEAPRELLLEALASARAAFSDYDTIVMTKAAMIGEMARLGQLDEAMKRVRYYSRGTYDRTESLLAICRVLDGKQKNAVSAELLRTAKSIEQTQTRNICLAKALPHLPLSEQRGIARKLIAEDRERGVPLDRVRMEIAALPFLDEPERHRIAGAWLKAILRHPHLEDDISALVPHAEEAIRVKVFRSLSAFETSVFVNARVALAASLSAPSIRSFLSAVRARRVEKPPTKVLTELLWRLAETGHVEEAIGYACAGAELSHPEMYWDTVGPEDPYALARLARHLPKAQRVELYDLVLCLRPVEWASELLADIVPWLEDDRRPEATDIFLKWNAENPTSKRAVLLVKYVLLRDDAMARALGERTVRAVLEASREAVAFDLVQQVVPIWLRQPPELKFALLREALVSWSDLPRWAVARLLQEIVPILGELGGGAALARCFDAIDLVWGWWGET